MGKHSRCVIGECGNDMWNPELHKKGFALQWDGGGGGLVHTHVASKNMP